MQKKAICISYSQGWEDQFRCLIAATSFCVPLRFTQKCDKTHPYPQALYWKAKSGKETIEDEGGEVEGT